MGLALIMTDFNDLENHTPEFETVVAASTSNDAQLERELLKEFLATMETPHYHIGYNSEVYPKFRIQRIPVLTRLEI